MAGKFILGLIVVILGIVAGWYVFSGKLNTGKIELPKSVSTNSNLGSAASPTLTGTYSYTETLITGAPQPTGSVTTKGGVVANDQTPGKVVVQYTDSGFTPMVITVKIRTAVTFTNSSSKPLWVQSDPQHGGMIGFDETAQVANGGSYTYVFAKVGTWKYFNHLATGYTGTVIVTQ